MELYNLVGLERDAVRDAMDGTFIEEASRVSEFKHAYLFNTSDGFCMSDLAVHTPLEVSPEDIARAKNQYNEFERTHL